MTVWQPAGGGYTSADAPNVGESAAAITRQTNMPQNTTQAPAIPLSRASSTGRIGFTITAQEISLPPLDTIYAFDVLNVYHQAFKMHQRRVLKENDWYGWLHWMRNSFRDGTIKEHWKEIEVSEWFGPMFRNFINDDVIGS
ncbi:MAG: hypothetical protein WBZ36_21935 [Candidatus Nitrosopolaris sp.]